MYNRIYKQKQYAADYSRYYGEDENRGMSTGAKVGLGALGTAGAAAGAIAIGRRGFLGAKAMRTINSGWAKAGAMFGHEGMISEGARGVVAAEQLAKGNINRRGANVIRQGNYKKLLEAENPGALYGFKKDANINQELRKIKDSELSWRNKHEDMVLTGDSARKNRIKKLEETKKIEKNNKEADKVKDTVKNDQ